MNGDTEARFLTSFRVKDLYGKYSHEIDLSHDTFVTAVIGPNGIGKTICLRMIEALFNRNFVYFTTIRFSTASFVFSDGTSIELRRGGDQHVLDFSETDQKIGLHFELRKDGNVTQSDRWSLDLNHLRRLYARVKKDFPSLIPQVDGSWVDERDGEFIPAEVLASRFGMKLPSAKSKDSNEPAEFSALISGTKCRFIQAQRLILTSGINSERGRYYDRPPQLRYAISDKSLKLKSIIQKEFNSYATLSQSMERTFPQRAINSVEETGNVSNIEEQILELERRRAEYTEVGLIDLSREASIVLPEGKLNQSIAKVLEIYIEDGNEKLKLLSEIYQKLALFKELIDDRFYPKSIRMSKESGIVVNQDGATVPLDALSSGEQNQLVLFFELIFESGNQSLLLIDEPEISLHIAWQRKFIPDLIRVIEINGFRTILATHSPQLIGNYRELVVELGGVE